ncbi:hypothetical protein BMS3Abin04_01795 [bacterium BMS3Abin04]|nr:hypothetical protein BMS3Abin04_01795 [bacterium BMS3Abin04]
MINKKNFYSASEHPTKRDKRIIWKGIKNAIKKNERSKLLRIETRSFVYGMITALVLFFSFKGIVSTVENYFYKYQPNIVKLNRIYSETAENLERILPAAELNKPHSVRVDDLISSKNEHLKSLNYAINQTLADTKTNNMSPVKQKILTSLYFSKLKVLENLILLERTDQ